jgi:hypothetical protein
MRNGRRERGARFHLGHRVLDADPELRNESERAAHTERRRGLHAVIDGDSLRLTVVGRPCARDRERARAWQAHPRLPTPRFGRVKASPLTTDRRSVKRTRGSLPRGGADVERM